MCDYNDSSQLKLWLYSIRGLEKCRARANRKARKALAGNAEDSQTATTTSPPPLAESFASGYTQRHPLDNNDDEEDVNVGAKSSISDDDDDDMDDGPWENEQGHTFVSPKEEAVLISFYASKLPNLIGPAAEIPRLRRDMKVVATAALLFRRFYLSNSVLTHDPKAIMVAAAFLGSKIEDATIDIRYLEEGTQKMQAPVTTAEIITAELALVTGIHFNFLCFHPYKAVLALTEDLRTYLKSEKGKSLAHFLNTSSSASKGLRTIVGQDLKPMHDAARKIIDDVIVSDIPLLYSPGQVGLAALMVANDELQEQQQQQVGQTSDVNNLNDIPQIDLRGYLRQRFEGRDDGIEEVIENLCDMLKGLKHGQYNCANHQVDMAMLKSVHKKLKKCKGWGKESSSSSGKKKKRKSRDDYDTTQPLSEPDVEHNSKRVKTS